MRYSMVANVLVGLVGMVVVGCGIFESGPPQETRKEYSKFIQGKMDQLREAHARLVVHVQQGGLESERQTVSAATLDDLTKQVNSVQERIKALNVAKGQNWFTIQFVMNHTLEELAQSYEKALCFECDVRRPVAQISQNQESFVAL